MSVAAGYSRTGMKATKRITVLHWNPLNPRDQAEARADPALAGLADSIKAKGVLQPLLILPDGTIVAGHRRWLAAQLAGAKEIPVTIQDLDEAAQIEAMLVENHQRKSLNPLQTALTCKALLDRGRTLNEIGRQTGMSIATATKYLQVLKMPEQVQRAVGNYDLPLAAVQHLARLRKEPDDLQEVAERGRRECVRKTEIQHRVAVALGERKKRGPGPGRPPTGDAPSPKDTPTHLAATLTEARFFLRRHPEYVREAEVRSAIKDLAACVKEAQRIAGE